MDRAIDATSWVDQSGNSRRTPSRNRARLEFAVRLHADLRAFVFARDGFTCQKCGVVPAEIPQAYDGRYAVKVDPGLCLVMDHRVSVRNGGTHHPSNLQTYCDSCNARKSCLIDRKLTHGTE